jgi:hypothetical protein
MAGEIAFWEALKHSFSTGSVPATLITRIALRNFAGVADDIFNCKRMECITAEYADDIPLSSASTLETVSM